MRGSDGSVCLRHFVATYHRVCSQWQGSTRCRWMAIPQTILRPSGWRSTLMDTTARVRGLACPRSPPAMMVRRIRTSRIIFTFETLSSSPSSLFPAVKHLSCSSPSSDGSTRARPATTYPMTPNWITVNDILQEAKGNGDSMEGREMCERVARATAASTSTSTSRLPDSLLFTIPLDAEKTASLLEGVESGGREMMEAYLSKRTWEEGEVLLWKTRTAMPVPVLDASTSSPSSSSSRTTNSITIPGKQEQGNQSEGIATGRWDATDGGLDEGVVRERSAASASASVSALEPPLSHALDDSTPPLKGRLHTAAPARRLRSAIASPLSVHIWLDRLLLTLSFVIVLYAAVVTIGRKLVEFYAHRY